MILYQFSCRRYGYNGNVAYSLWLMLRYQMIFTIIDPPPPPPPPQMAVCRAHNRHKVLFYRSSWHYCNSSRRARCEVYMWVQILIQCSVSVTTVFTFFNNMMTSSNGNIFRVTGLLCGGFTGDRWIPRAKASDAWLWCFLWSAPE